MHPAYTQSGAYPKPVLGYLYQKEIIIEGDSVKNMKYSVMEAILEEHKSDIMAVIKRNIKSHEEAWYIWKFTSCPSGATRTWLSQETGSGAFIATASLFPRKYLINGESCTLAIAGDYAIDPEHRIYGPAIRLVKTLKTTVDNDDFILINGVPNEPTEPLFTKSGFKVIGSYGKYVKILKTKYKSNEYLPPVSITKPLAKLIDIMLTLLSKPRELRRSPTLVNVEHPHSFDERFDTLWEKSSMQNKISAERNSEYLNWRFKQSPAHDYQIFATVRSGGELEGYIVHIIKENMSHSIDFLSLDQGKTYDTLLVKFIIYMRKKGIGSISGKYMGNDGFVKRLKAFKFFQRKKEDKKVIAYCKDDSRAETLLNKNNWYFLAGDRDT